MSSKAMRRRQRDKMAFRQNHCMVLADLKKDVWIVSSITGTDTVVDVEIHGRDKALKFFRRLFNLIPLV